MIASAIRWTACLALLASGCAGRLTVPGKPAHGNLLAVTAKASSKAAKREARQGVGAPLVVLIERRGLRGVDPVDASDVWFRPLRVTGHPAASATTVYVPIRGHRLAAVDRETGKILWDVTMPGEALTGLTVAEPFVALSVVDPRKGRSRVAALSTYDGTVRWMRRTKGRFGVPAATGRVVLVPLAGQVLALRMGTGRELARLDVPAEAGPDLTPAYERVEVRGASLLAGIHTRWVDLGAARGAARQERSVEPGYGSVFQAFEGLDPGHDDAERLRLWVRFAPDGSTPREAVLLCRRAVVALRLGPDGTGVHAHWAYLTKDDREFVAMDVGKERITLVWEDGRILQLATSSGHELDRIKGSQPTRGALILDVSGGPGNAKRPRPKPKAVRVMLREIVRDADPRLLPVQRLAAGLMWRDDDVETRQFVEKLAHGGVRSDPTAAAEDLRAHALDLVAGPWGRPGQVEESGLRYELAQRPSFLYDQRPPVAQLARQVVRSGNADLIPHLVEHLLHPATPAADLAEIATALAELGRPDAIDGVATFVRRYHADAEVVYASRALHLAVDYLAEQAAQADSAQAVLEEVFADPFTEPALRAYIGARLPERPPAPAQPAAHDDPAPPQLSALPASRL